MDRTRSGGLRRSMPSVMKHRHARWATDGLVCCAGLLAPKSMVRLTIGFWPSESRRTLSRSTPPTHRQKLRTSATLCAVRSARQDAPRRHQTRIGGTVTHAEVSRLVGLDDPCVLG